MKESDIVYTPEWLAKGTIKILNPFGVVLDPCKGEGVYYNNFPGEKDWCEIRQGKCFFEYQKKVDWIISNPPYSIFLRFLHHSVTLANDISFLVPINKVFQSQKVMNCINEYGGIKSIFIIGDARQYLGFPFGYSVANFHFQKGYKGQTEIHSGIKKVKELINHD